MTRTRALIIALALLLGGAACTPHDAIQLTFGQIHGDRVAQEATRIASCETGGTFNPNAVSPTNDHGLFQINIIHARQFERVTGQSWAKRYDPFWNAVYAKWLYEQQGWRPWTCRHAA